MITKIALVVCGFTLASAFGFLYFMVLSMITTALLRIDNEIILQVEFWICYVTGAVTAFGLMREGWPTRKKDRQAGMMHRPPLLSKDAADRRDGSGRVT